MLLIEQPNCILIVLPNEEIIVKFEIENLEFWWVWVIEELETKKREENMRIFFY